MQIDPTRGRIPHDVIDPIRTDFPRQDVQVATLSLERK
jgi:hypothetical protein